MEPRFTVIIPSYNRAAILGKAIESVLYQSFRAFEVIVVDDGSTDLTQLVVEAFPPVSYYYQENQGVSAARNRGAKMAKGNWLIFLDSDDELLPQALQNYSKAIIENSSASVLLGGYLLKKNGEETLLIPGKGKYIGFLAGSFAVKKEVFDIIGGYDASLKFAENTELFFRIDQSNSIQKNVQLAVVKYNQHEEGGNNNLIETTKSLLYILEKHPQISSRVKRLYHQILGVNYLRFRQFPEARNHFKKAYKINPFKLDTLVRWGIAWIPLLAKKLYSPFPLNR